MWQFPWNVLGFLIFVIPFGCFIARSGLLRRAIAPMKMTAVLLNTWGRRPGRFEGYRLEMKVPNISPFHFFWPSWECSKNTAGQARP